MDKDEIKYILTKKRSLKWRLIASFVIVLVIIIIAIIIPTVLI